MKRVFIYSGLILMTLFAAVSCNDLDEIRESISDLQERVEALEQKMEENITALQSMVTLGSVASCEFQADSGKVVITLLDGQTLVIDQNVSGQALVSVRKALTDSITGLYVMEMRHHCWLSMETMFQ